MNPVLDQLQKLAAKRNSLLETLLAPARAACNAMLDAGMKRSAEPLSEILFQIDAVSEEINKVFSTADPTAIVQALIEGIGRSEDGIPTRPLPEGRETKDRQQ